jgi:hypothetical protein
MLNDWLAETDFELVTSYPTEAEIGPYPPPNEPDTLLAMFWLMLHDAELARVWLDGIAGFPATIRSESPARTSDYPNVMRNDLRVAEGRSIRLWTCRIRSEPTSEGQREAD